LPGLRTEQNATSTNLIGGYIRNKVTGGVIGAVIGGGGENGFAHSVTDNYSTIGGGRNNQAGDDTGTAEDASYATVGGGSGNVADGKLSTIGGGLYNKAEVYASTVAGGQANRATEYDATVGGGNSNTAGGQRATVGGGRYNFINENYGTIGGGESNRVYEQHGTVAGGHSNTAQGRYSAISGGDNNIASGHESVIGGGDDNRTGGTYSTVSGGHSNSASGHSSSVGGGWDNSARGSYSTIPGGYLNEADGNWSFAAGTRSKARHEGSFVWADADYYTDFISTGNDQFLIRASGGVGIGTNSPTEALDVNGTVKATTFIGDGNGLTNLSVDSGWTVSGDNVYSAVSGNVGIGTTDPNALLEIAGPSANLDLTSTSGLGPMVTFDHLGSLGGGSTLGSIDFKWGVSNPVAQISAGAGSDSVNQDNAYLRFKTASEGVPIERMRIDEEGNVGIGTTSPGEKLAVSLDSGSGDIASFSALNNKRFMISIDGSDTDLSAQSGNNLKLGTSFSGTSVTVLNSTGHVGVDTTNPFYPLEVRTTADNIFATSISNESTTGSGLEVRVGSSGTESAFHVYRDEGIASTLVKVGSNGNVGIGTANPDEKLEVNGNIKLGTGEDLYAPGTPSNTKILRGYILGDGTAMWSEGVTSQRTGTGAYSVTFDYPFSSVPTVVTTTFGGSSVSSLTGFNANSFSVQTRNLSSGSAIDAPFTFIVIGPR
jgi:hypothetical protein